MKLYSKSAIWIIFASLTIVGFVNMTPTAFNQNTVSRVKLSITKRSDILFSARFPERKFNSEKPLNGQYTTAEALISFKNFKADALIWHDPHVRGIFNSTLLSQIKKYSGLNVPIKQCSLPAFTRNPMAACKDALGRPVPWQNIPGVFYPETNSFHFRRDVENFIISAKLGGCTSLQQDNQLYMVYGQNVSGANYLGCRTSLGANNQIVKQPREQIFEDLKRYYTWVRTRVKHHYGHDIPMTYNKHFYSLRGKLLPSSDFLAPFFDGATSEVHQCHNNPLDLMSGIVEVNRQRGKLTTMTTLVSPSIQEQQRHFAGVYALAGQSIIPWDVFIDMSHRYYGQPQHFLPLVHFVKKSSLLLDGTSTIGAYARSKEQEGACRSPIPAHGSPPPDLQQIDPNARIGLPPNTLERRVGARIEINSNEELLVVLRGRLSANSPQAKRILHLVRWKDHLASGSSNQFAVSIPSSIIPTHFNSVKVYKIDGTSQVLPIHHNGGKVTITFPSFTLWAIAEFM